MANENFFEDPKEQSVVKSTIVQKYFWAWAKIMISVQKRYNRDTEKIAYIDLFAGPGRYEDNTKSTPLLVLEHAIKDPEMSKKLVTFFNDTDPENVRSLGEAIQNLSGINNLSHTPVIENIEVGAAIIEQFQKTSLVPTLLFIDPWGYKGLSLNLIDAVLKNWGCDCIFFFNYNRINMGLNNSSVKEHMDALFGETRADELRGKLKYLNPDDRELAIVEELGQAFQNLGYEYVLPFRFTNDKGSRTSHHLIFVTKDFRGYDIMKGIMAGVSSSSAQNVASFEYNPADVRTPLLFELTRPIDELAQMLLLEFSGKTMSFMGVYKTHSIGKPYIKKNYKSVFKQLEKDGEIITNPPSSKRRRDTFSDKVIVTFPNSQ